jgi:NAD(P)-dependent dehydrogenase (short-subunit alcohol dehydrogenase family)
MDLALRDKVALITGGSQGIGLAVAEGLAREGVHLILSARDSERLRNEATGLESRYGIKTLAIPADVSKSEDTQRLVEESQRAFQGIDLLFSNAGMGSREKILEAPDEKWQYYWDLQVMASVRLARGIVPLMRLRGGGVIIHNSSICAKQPIGYEPIYNVTKAALMMFSKCLANEVIGDNIRVNCVNPGLIQTSGWEEAAKQETQGTGKNWEQHLEEIAQKNAPIGRFATPEELSNFIVFLFSPMASYCIGSSYYVDGGWLNVVA